MIMKGNVFLENLEYIWPSPNMDFWKVEINENKIIVNWSHNYFKDYKLLSYQFYECGYQIFDEVIGSEHDNVKADMWFLTGIYLIRHGIELGLKALLCRNYHKNKDIQNAFKECCHDVSKLFQRYCDIGKESYLTGGEQEWIIKYLYSLEEVDKKSDMFRFPFDDKFLSKYSGKFLDNVDVANNLSQAFNIIKKCIQEGEILEEEKFNHTLEPNFFIFSNGDIDNCFLQEKISDKGFHTKITGYNDVIDYIYNCKHISKITKIYPLMFMSRNVIELCLKRIFYINIDDGVPFRKKYSKRKSHLLKKDLWKNVRPIVYKYIITPRKDVELIEIIDSLIDEINLLDKKGDNFRYPTSYSLEYRFDNKYLDLNNVYKYFKSLINFLIACNHMLDSIADYQNEMFID